MMDAILMSMVWLIQTVVHYSIGAVLLVLAAVGLVAAARWLLSGRGAERVVPGSPSSVAAATLLVGLVSLTCG